MYVCKTELLDKIREAIKSKPMTERELAQYFEHDEKPPTAQELSDALEVLTMANLVKLVDTPTPRYWEDSGYRLRVLASKLSDADNARERMADALLYAARLDDRANGVSYLQERIIPTTGGDFGYKVGFGGSAIRETIRG